MKMEYRSRLADLLNRLSDELTDCYLQAALAALPGDLVATRAPSRTTKTVRIQQAAAPQVKPASRAPRATPDEVDALGVKIVATLRTVASPIAARALAALVGAPPDAVRYALAKLKESQAVVQIGERRLAVYALPARVAKKAPVRSVQAPATTKAAKAATPAKPLKGAKAATPAKPLKGAKAATPAKPVKAASPAKPVDVVKPAKVAKPVQAAKVAKPVQAAKPVKVAQEAKPEQAAIPAPAAVDQAPAAS